MHTHEHAHLPKIWLVGRQRQAEKIIMAIWRWPLSVLAVVSLVVFRVVSKKCTLYGTRNPRVEIVLLKKQPREFFQCH